MVGGNRSHWIKFKLVGTRSNRDGIGTTVTVAAGDLLQAQQRKSGGSYLSSHDPRLNFGLGARDHIDSVEIHWPSRQAQHLGGMKANQIVTFTEP